ncbi:hypothetical protein QBC34DRAFT_78986 [Podospora aff. communis PSN243]|uniref:Heterokaryon incompatibility domain-containing protein n=1 Tax=Podospora aff. communis PSN243 TaxID=3040156 RepID=A0AAV9GQP3_9PEZI|nr:hypothetical protein QBC34DRAFT_78986 [Podospora aff. communis PSN243]
MDYIQLPLDGLEAIEVPFISRFVFDLQDFATFPTRVGFPSVHDRAGWRELSADDTASIAQSWLYFGLLSAFFGRNFDRNKFVVDNNVAGPRVTSTTLLPLLDDWAALQTRGEPSEKDRVEELLDSATRSLRVFSFLPQSGLSPLPEILLSIHLLITTLHAAAGDGRTLSESAPRPTSETQDVDPAAQLILGSLLDAGWCPWKAHQILSEYSYMTIYYISRLRNPTAPHITHAACTKDRCIGNNVDMDNYTTRHTEPSCLCHHSFMSDEEMRSIISSGGIPVARIRLSKSGSPYLQVKRAGPQTRYIAFSHVWSDGLGNPRANSLPECQLKRLRTSLQLLAPPMFDFTQGYMAVPQLNLGVDGKRLTIAWGSTEWFWLDTLCIPVGSDDESLLLKSKAINQMAAIYAGAHQVLVLDSVMEASKLVGRDACHVLAQLSAVAWLGRCWTYQEGALALALQVQCADCSFDPAFFDNVAVEDSESNEEIYILLPGTLNVGRSWKRAWQAVSLGLKRGVKALDDNFIRELRGLPAARKRKNTGKLLAKYVYGEITDVVSREMRYDRRGPDSLVPSDNIVEDFILCWNALAQRTTTMAGDIHVIIANLMRLNAFSILKMENQEERMRAILWSLPEIPLSLLFNRSKKRVRPSEQHVDRWMPLWPNRYTLAHGPGMQKKDGVLSLVSSDIAEVQRPRLLLLEAPLLANGGPTELLIGVESDTQVDYYRIVLHRQPGDEFDSSGSHSTVFILEPKESKRSTSTSNAHIQSACLHVDALFHKASSPVEGGSCYAGPSVELQFLTTFDCPATIYPLTSNGIPAEYMHLAQYSASCPKNYHITVQHGTPSTLEPLPQRPPNPMFMWITGLVLCLCFPFNYLLCAMNAMVIYQNITQRDSFPSSVFVASILTIISHAYTFLVAVSILPVFMLVPPVISGLSWNIIPFAIGLVYVALKAGMEEMGSIDKVVIGLLVAGHVPQIVMVAVVRWYVNPRVYRAWLETFDPDWKPEKTDWMLNKVTSLISLLRRMEK